MRRYGAVKTTGFTRKQIGVLYRKAKDGELKIEKWVMSEFYDLADYYGYDDHGSVEKCDQQIKQILEYVFSGDLENAQMEIDNYTEREYSLMGRIRQECVDRSFV